MTFQDFDPAAKGHDEWMDLVRRDIVHGHPDGNACPERDVTNTELAKMLYRGAEIPVRDLPTSFPDFPDRALASYLTNALDAGMLRSGAPDATPTSAEVLRAFHAAFTISPKYQSRFQNLCNARRSGANYDEWIDPVLEDGPHDHDPPMKRAAVGITLSRLLALLGAQ